MCNVTNAYSLNTVESLWVVMSSYAQDQTTGLQILRILLVLIDVKQLTG